MKTIHFFTLFSIILSLSLLSSCSSDDAVALTNDFVVAFKESSENFPTDSSTHIVPLVYSKPAPKDGYLTIAYTSNNLIYGEDFNVDTPDSEESIFLPIEKGTSETSFTLNKLKEILLEEDSLLIFTITEVFLEDEHSFAQGNTSTTIFFTPSTSLGGVIAPEVGGPNQPNQVYVSLSTKEQRLVQRDTWDLAFYSREDFRVKLNGSIYMFAAPLNHTNIDEVTANHIGSLKTEMDFLVPGSDVFVDNPNGDIEDTALKAISEIEEENPVYLLKLGYKIGTDTPSPGGIAVAGDPRGYKKIRILKRGDDYVLQYASLQDSSHKEVILSKSPEHNFTFFSFDSENSVMVEPKKDYWDLNFTVKTETQDLPEGGKSAYGFSDYVETNTLGNVKAYRVYTDIASYDDFNKSDIEEEKFIINQRVIGSSWREVIPPQREVNSTIFYVLKDARENYYKLQFLSLLNENGDRGYPTFKYELLN